MLQAYNDFLHNKLLKYCAALRIIQLDGVYEPGWE